MENSEEKKVVEIPPELVEYMKKKIEEEKREEEKKEREEALQELKKYIPHLVSVPDDVDAKHIKAIAGFLGRCEYKPREKRPSTKLDFRNNKLAIILLGAIIVVGIIGVIF